MYNALKLESAKTKSRTKTNKPKTDAQVKKILKKINVLILGPGYPPNELKKRIEIRRKLKKLGLSAYVMEQKPQPKRQTTHVDKFHELLDMENLLCIAISTPNGYSNGLTFEIGYICGLFGRTKTGRARLQRELGFIISKKANQKEILTSYITSGLFYDGILHCEYSNTKDIIKLVEIMVKNRAIHLGLL